MIPSYPDSPVLLPPESSLEWVAMSIDQLLRPNAFASTVLQTSTSGGSGGTPSWDFLILAVIVGLVIICLAWLLSGGSGSAD